MTEQQMKHSGTGQHDVVRQTHDDVKSDGRYEEGIEYRVGDVKSLSWGRSFDIVAAIHLLHYLETEAEIESVLRGIHGSLSAGGHFVTVIANPEFDLEKHDPFDSRTKFGDYFSVAEPGDGGLLRFHPRLARPVHQR